MECWGVVSKIYCFLIPDKHKSLPVTIVSCVFVEYEIIPIISYTMKSMSKLYPLMKGHCGIEFEILKFQAAKQSVFIVHGTCNRGNK